MIQPWMKTTVECILIKLLNFGYFFEDKFLWVLKKLFLVEKSHLIKNYAHHASTPASPACTRAPQHASTHACIVYPCRPPAQKESSGMQNCSLICAVTKLQWLGRPQEHVSSEGQPRHRAQKTRGRPVGASLRPDKIG